MFGFISMAKEKIKWFLYALAFVIAFQACSTSVSVDQSFPDYVSEGDITPEFSLNQVEVTGNVQPFNTEIRVDTIDEFKYIINLSLYTDFPSALPSFQFNIKYPLKLVDVLWSSRTWSNQSFINIPNYSRLQSDYNVVSALSQNNKNRLTLATFDNFEGRYTGIDIQRDADSIVFSMNYFQHSVPDAELLEYKTQIFVNLCDTVYSDAIRECAQWRLDKQDHSSLKKVDLSLLPVYSMWYPLSRNIPVENVTYYFDSIASMGFRSVLFDDGWQDVVSFNVDTAGVWDPSETVVVKEFMNMVHEKDMKVALWYSKPFIGAHNYVFKRFEGYYVQYITSSQPILDIRYPRVRDYLVDMYKNILSEWGVDAVLFDFLNGYYPDEHIIVTEDRGRDFVSVRKALDSLRTRMRDELVYNNPEIEISQSFPSVGPLHTSNSKTINGFLGTTVLNDVREKLVNNRLMYGEYSPFMEVMGIHPRDPALEVALKFQSILYGTPYLSFFSYTLSEELRETVNFWVRYWIANKEILLQSDFKALNPVQRYSILKAGTERKQIITVYGRVSYVDMGYFSFETADVINSSGYPQITLYGTPTGKIDYITYNHSGVYQDRGTLRFRRDFAEVDVPKGGFVRLIVK